jgi:23S rRNA pseudouridine1911/1915/1917 synthase
MSVALGMAEEPRVVFEDEAIVAVHKPPRMHSAPGLGGGGLCSWVFERYPEVRAVGLRPKARHQAPSAPGVTPPEGSPEGGLLHRLDYETSGLVLFARNREAFSSLLDQQAKGSFHKEYLAFSAVSNAAEPRGSRPSQASPKGVESEAWAASRAALDASALAKLISGSLASGAAPALLCAFRPFGPKGARVACLDSSEASLDPRGAGEGPEYRSDIVGARSSGGEASLELRLSLARGFRHQIRAQLAWVGLPIVGDPLYGSVEGGRLGLYAVALSFAHPMTGRPMSLRDEEDSPR